MICDCNAFYVGKTIRELRQQIGDHLYYSANGKLTTIGRHIGLYHRFDPQVKSNFSFWKLSPRIQGVAIGTGSFYNMRPP